MSGAPHPLSGGQQPVTVKRGVAIGDLQMNRDGSSAMNDDNPPTEVVHLTRSERVAAGKAARKQVALVDQRRFEPSESRDPVGLLLGQADSRVPDLVPVRHGRMLVSPVHLLPRCGTADGRGSARPPRRRGCGCSCAGMRTWPTSARSPRRIGALVFDLNDFDETLPGPFEWDVKRLAASLIVAGRDNGYTAKESRRVALAAVAAYRTAMADFAGQSMMAVWYARLEVEDALRDLRDKMPKGGAQAAREADGQGALARQHAGPGQADRGRRRPTAVHQQPAADRPAQ